MIERYRNEECRCRMEPTDRASPPECTGEPPSSTAQPGNSVTLHDYCETTHEHLTTMSRHPIIPLDMSAISDRRNEVERHIGEWISSANSGIQAVLGVLRRIRPSATERPETPDAAPDESHPTRPKAG